MLELNEDLRNYGLVIDSEYRDTVQVDDVPVHSDRVVITGSFQSSDLEKP